MDRMQAVQRPPEAQDRSIEWRLEPLRALEATHRSTHAGAKEAPRGFQDVQGLMPQPHALRVHDPKAHPRAAQPSMDPHSHQAQEPLEHELENHGSRAARE